MLQRYFIVLSIILSSLLSSCTTIKNSTISCIAEQEIYVINHGWHTGLVISTKELNLLLPNLVLRFSNNQYYEIGWGDKGFYQANEMTASLAIQALFYSSGSVIHIAAFNEHPKQHFSKNEVIKLNISHDNYYKLLDFIKSSFATDAKGNIIQDKLGIYGNSQFYIATGQYHLFNTCNQWTANALATSGLNINPLFKLTASSVMDELKQQCQ